MVTSVLGIVIDVSALQPENTLVPIFVMLALKVIFSKTVQPENALLPISVTVDGISASVSLLATLQALAGIDVVPLSNITFVALF